MIAKKFLLLSFSLLFLSGCYYDVEKELYPASPDCTTTGITYSNTIMNIVNTNCAISGCHIAGTGRSDLTKYSGVNAVASNGSMRQKVLIDKSMPPLKPLSECEMLQIETWLKSGTPE